MTALEKLGYYFDDKDVLRTKKDGEGFKFTTQEDYERLGEAVDEEVYRLLETRCGLNKIALKPSGSNIDDEDVSFIFASKDYDEKETLLVLIHGSGVVRAGQWARRLIINESLETGTQFPYIERALKKDWGVVVFNTNHNSTESEELKFSETPVNHAQNAWKWFVETASAKKIHVVAHSRGGYDISCVLQKHILDERVKIVCLTDSPSFQFPPRSNERKSPLFVINFLAHGSYNSPQYKIRGFKKNEVVKLYAGTNTHERSSHESIDSVFHIFENDLNQSNFDAVIYEAKQMVKKNKEEEKETSSTKEEEEEEPDLKKKRVD